MFASASEWPGWCRSGRDEEAALGALAAYAARYAPVASEAGLEFGEYSPLEIKMSVVGYGRAEKGQVKMMVRSLLGQAIDSEDACDALAVAMCHAARRTAEQRIEAVRR